MTEQFKIGDEVRVVRIAEGYEDFGYKVGDVFTVKSVYDFDTEKGPIYDVDAGDGKLIELYHSEVASANADDVETSFYEDVTASLEQAIERPLIFLDGKSVPVGEGAIDMTTGKPVDMVQEPPHYARGGVEPIEYMEQILPDYEDSFVAFCAGNTLKYVSRAPHKGSQLQDLKKARQYLDFAINHMEKGKVK